MCSNNTKQLENTGNVYYKDLSNQWQNFKVKQIFKREF